MDGSNLARSLIILNLSVIDVVDVDSSVGGKYECDLMIRAE